MENTSVMDVTNGVGISSGGVDSPNQPVVSAVPDVTELTLTSSTEVCAPPAVPDQASSNGNISTDTASTAVLENTKQQTNPTCSVPTNDISVKSRSSREEKSRKKDDKSVDHVLRALNSLSTPEEKLAAMCKKYSDFFDEHRKLQVLQKQTEKRCSLLQREKEQLQAEQSKAILTRSRLENLCRELQRQNKAIKDESLLKIREEEEKRKDVSAKFQATMNEITTLMQQNSDKNMKLREDNIDMSTKLKSICEQYELRQQQVERISKQMQLEQQLGEAKLTKYKLEMATEREVFLKEKQELLLELQQYKQRCTEFQATELNLRNQITFYNDKYDEFQKSLARSNDVVGGFKGEMERMTKKITKLEKETSSWKQRWERSNNVQLEMAAAKQKSDQELAVVSRQLVTLQGLCRTLQTERSNLLTKLKLLQDGQSEPQEKCAINSLNKCNKQYNQTLNNLDSVAHIDQPMKNCCNSDPVLNHCSQDTQSPLNKSDAGTIVFPAAVVESEVKTIAATSTVKTPNNVSAPPVLPDVVGTTNVSSLNQKLGVDSVQCQRLETLTTDHSLQQANNTNQSSTVVKEVLQESEPVCDILSKQTPNEEKSLPQSDNVCLVNNDSLTNNSCRTNQDSQKDIHIEKLQPLQTPTENGESLDGVKKSKESKKKKK